jgi:hypothetical protein
MVERLLTDEQRKLLVNESVLDILTQEVSEQIRSQRLLFFHTNNSNIISKKPANSNQTNGGKSDDPNLTGITSKVVQLLNENNTEAIQAVLNQIDVEIPTELQGKPIGRNERIGLVLLADATRSLLINAINEHQQFNFESRLAINVDALKLRLQSTANKASVQRDTNIKRIKELLKPQEILWGKGPYSNYGSEASEIVQRLCKKKIHPTDTRDLRFHLAQLYPTLITEDREHRINAPKPMLYDPIDRVQCIAGEHLDEVAKVLLTKP